MGKTYQNTHDTECLAARQRAAIAIIMQSMMIKIWKLRRQQIEEAQIEAELLDEELQAVLEMEGEFATAASNSSSNNSSGSHSCSNSCSHSNSSNSNSKASIDVGSAQPPPPHGQLEAYSVEGPQLSMAAGGGRVSSEAG